MQAPFTYTCLMTLHWQSIDMRTNLLLDAHGGYCLALQSLKVSNWESGLQVRHDAVSVLQHTLSLLLQHGDARGAVLPVLHNAQVGKCSFPAATTPLVAANCEKKSLLLAASMPPALFRCLPCICRAKTLLDGQKESVAQRAAGVHSWSIWLVLTWQARP